jgi:ABC-type dipeptide/oligopeptide/nickel transport system permease subunit
MTKGAFRYLLRRPSSVASVLVLVVVVSAAIFAPLIAPSDPNLITGALPLQGPNAQHWLGTDEIGRDVLSRVIFGARVSLMVAVSAVAVAAVVGIVAGGLASSYGRWVESLVLRSTDVLLVFPEILLAIVLMALLGVSLVNVVIAIAVAYVPRFVRLTWSSLLVIREDLFNQAARVSGASELQILVRHQLPNILPTLSVLATTSLASAVLVESALSFLGLGVQPPNPSWGSMISSGTSYISQDPWVTIVPGFAILLTALAFNLLGDAIAEGLNPRLRQAGDSPVNSRAPSEVAVDSGNPTPAPRREG